MSTSGTTPSTVMAIGFIFDATDRLIRATLKDLPAEAFWKQPAEGSNSIGWVIGHITQSRAGLLTRIGEPVDTGWGDLFKRGAEKRDPSGYPAADELKRAGIDITSRLRGKLERLTEKDLQAPVAELQRLNVNTVAEALAFFAFHESYHVGQLGYIRKQLGYTAIAG
jgi:uncharacterized damage-inducible protein DinB